MLTDMRPIGYWLKHLDDLLERTFERTLQTEQLTRRHWQILNVIAQGVDDPAAVRQALAPFTVGDEASDLIGRGWLTTHADGSLALTTSGQQAHARLLERVRATRQQMMLGLSDADYRATVVTLERMADNLSERATAS